MFHQSLALALSLFVSTQVLASGWIDCAGVEPGDGVAPTLIIKDIGSPDLEGHRYATLVLNLDGGRPDTRNSDIAPYGDGDHDWVNYYSHKSSVNPTLPQFAVYSDGTDSSNTHAVTIYVAGRSEPIPMSCHDGLQAEQQ